MKRVVGNKMGKVENGKFVGGGKCRSAENEEGWSDGDVMMKAEDGCSLGGSSRVVEEGEKEWCQKWRCVE